MSKEIINGLLQLGFNQGWVLNGEEITLWEHSTPIPSKEQILEAAKSYIEPELSVADKLSSVGLTVEDLKKALGI